MYFVAGNSGATTTTCFPLLLAAVLTISGISAHTNVSSSPCQDKLSNVYSPHGPQPSVWMGVTFDIGSVGRTYQDCLTSHSPSDGSTYPDCTESLFSNAVLEARIITETLNEMKEVYVSIMNQNIRFASFCFAFD